MSQETNNRIVELLLGLCGELARNAVSKSSRTLAEALQEQGPIQGLSVGQTLGRLHIPHYWAQFVHNGRGEVRPRQAAFLVWFRNPRDDPRLPPGRWPVRVEELRRFTSESWDFWTQQNKAARAAGRPEPMIIRRVSGPVAANPFYSHGPGGGMQSLTTRLEGVIHAEVQRLVTAELVSTFGRDEFVRSRG